MRHHLSHDIGGALLFGIPLVYTMEVWWLGQRSDLSVTAAVVAAVAVASGLVRYAVDRPEHLGHALLVGVRSTALSLGLAAIFAFVLGVVRLGSSASEVLGIVGAVGVPLSLGSVLGTVLFTDKRARDEGGSASTGSGGGEAPEEDDGNGGDGEGEHGSQSRGSTRGLLHVCFASALGAAFLALPIAPTDEVPMVAANLDGWRGFGIVAAASVACYVVLIASGFLQKRTSGPTIEPVEAIALTATVVVVGIMVGALLLLVGGKLPLDGGSARIIGNIAALSVPAIIGSAAGRLVAA